MHDRLPISVLLLARDEAERLAALLPALDFAREVVVVVDAGSRDGTRELAEAHGARVFVRALDGFGAQRRFALEQCREEWVLWLDADERLDRAALASLRGALSAGAAGFRWTRRTWFLGGPIRFCGWQGEKVLRLFRRAAGEFDDAPVHERLTVRGSVGDLPGLIEHHSYRNWDECRDKLVRYATAGAEKLRRKGRRAGPLDLIARPPLRFLRMYLLQLGFLDGARGLTVCALAAAQVLLRYTELWAQPRSEPTVIPPPDDRAR